VSRARSQDGFTLVELLVAMAVSLLVFGAVLTVFESMLRQSKLADDQAEVETRARQSADRLARQLRNLASPADIVTNIEASTQPKSVDRNLPSDLIFKDVADTLPAGSLNSAGVRRVRYCLQTSGPVAGTTFSASPSNGVLWMQSQTWTTATPLAMPAGTECPAAGWTTQRIVADHLVNPADKPLFRYSGDAGQITGTSDLDRERIARVESTVVVDADPTRAPSATQLTTAVVLRNQNRAPVASFTYALQNPVTCAVQLNGSASQDPESKPLKYEWWVDGVKRTVETGVVVQLLVTKGTHTYQLKVYDPARLIGTSSVETRTCI
jgi:prepilin-type N-terminal cleavage/methylation domain-containing protein